MISFLQVEGLTKSFGDLELYDDLKFGIDQGQKVAIVAKNGAGKTTLLNILAGVDSADKGSIVFRKDIKISFLAQEPILDKKNTIIEEVYASSKDILTAINDYHKAIESGDNATIEKSMAVMDHLNAWDFETKANQILSRLKIFDVNQKISELSGGQQKRVAMASVILKNPDFLILDEPTNHLDLDMIEWLEEYLHSSNCTLLMVTHDRYFLDRVCNLILEIDDKQIYTYKGNYSYFLEKRAERLEIARLGAEKARNLMRTEQEWMRRMPKARGTKAKYRVDQFHELKKEASYRKVEKSVNINVQQSRLGKKILEISELSKSFGDKVILKDFSYKFSRFEKVGIIGDNGTGKSTFVNLITGNLESDGGVVDVGQTIKFGYYNQKGLDFNPKDKVIDVVREVAEVVTLSDGTEMSVTQFLNYFLFPPDTHHAYVEKLSGGEKRRLYLLTVLMQNPNFLILDEPTNDLDIMTLNVLEEYLEVFGGCVIIVSHDRFFMDKVVDHLFVFNGDGDVKDFPGNYTQYRDHVEVKEEERKREEAKSKEPKETKKPTGNRQRKLTFKEKKELEELEIDIERMEKRKKELEEALASGNLSSEELVEQSKEYQQLEEELDEKSMRWLELSEI
jgi:ATP-binding cassette subfamily F protein uup